MDIALAVAVVLGLVLGIYKFWSVTTQPVVAVIAVNAGALLAGIGAAWLYGGYLTTGKWDFGGSVLLRSSPISVLIGGVSVIAVGVIGIARYKARRRMGRLDKQPPRK